MRKSRCQNVWQKSFRSILPSGYESHFAQFLSSEARTLIGIQNAHEWEAYAIERFKGILDLTVKSSVQTHSPIPAWAAEKVKEAWNVH
jgi:hypothetical protein